MARNGAPSKRSNSGWFLNHKIWKLNVGQWIAVLLAFAGIVVVFSLLFVRRQTLEYRLEHSFTVDAPEFFSSALALGNPVPIGGNKIQLLHNGDEYFPAMLEAIRSAEGSVNFESFIMKSDTVGRQFMDALSERARAGVQVRVLLDGIGSSWSLNNSDVRAMKEAGVKFEYYHPVRHWRLDRTNRRTHRRVLVVDGRVGFTGGAAFADLWAGNAQDPKHWRDTHARIEGPVVAQMQAAFQQHWAGTGQEALTGAHQFPALPPAGPLQAQVVTSSAFSAAPVPLLQAVAFASATKRIWIANPYCTPTDDTVDMLVKAVQRGVDVRLMLPGEHHDQPHTASAGRAAYGRMLEGGVKIFEYQETMMHMKTMVVDGMFSMVGSSNFDARSMEINEELDVVVYDAGFGAEMEAVFEKDLQRCREYTYEEFQNRSLWQRFTEWVMLPFRPQL